MGPLFHYFTVLFHQIQFNLTAHFVGFSSSRVRCNDRPSNFEMILSLLRELGYVTTTAKLRTDQFGIPQRRSRIYFFGIREACMDSEKQKAMILERLDALQQDLVLTPESCFMKKG